MRVGSERANQFGLLPEAADMDKANAFELGTLLQASEHGHDLALQLRGRQGNPRRQLHSSSSWHSGSYVCPPSVQECQIRNLVPATRLFGRIILRQLIDLWRQRALIEQEAFKAFDVLIALGELLPMLFEV